VAIYKFTVGRLGLNIDNIGCSPSSQIEIQQFGMVIIEVFYNRQRKQARLEYLSPAAFTNLYNATLLAA
jgi:putative transposase